jgi:hypothetical protein
MKPIGQTFFINEPPPPTGVPGVYITQVDVYFENVSSVYGVQLEIRTTENGVPTSNRLPFALKTLQVTDTYSNTTPIIRASTDATVPTSFIFDTPIFCQSRTSYAFVVSPLGGNPDYNIWTAQVSENDVTTGTPIYTKSDNGDLFLSSNDKDWEPIINEDIKYTIYTANFTATSGNAYFNVPDEDWFIFTNPVGNFQMREPIVFGNGYFNIASFNVTGTSGTISIGDTVYQSNGSANVYGKVYFSNSSTIKVSNTTGVFSITSGGTPLLYDSTSGANTAVTAVTQNVVTNAFSNVVFVPDSSIFSANQVIYLQTNNGSNSQIVSILITPNTAAIVVNSAVAFTDTNALYGSVLDNGALTGRYSGHFTNNNISYGVFDTVTSNASVNLAKVSNVVMFGMASGATANFVQAFDVPYNSLTTNFSSIAVPNTYLSWSFQGFQNNASYTPDPSFIPLVDGQPNEFTDYERLAMSVSDELQNLPLYRQGNSSVVINVGMTSDNTKITPVIDTMRTNVTYTYNLIPQQYQLTGAILTIANNSGVFTNGDIVSQTSYGNTTTGIIRSANSTTVAVTNVNGLFSSNVAFTTSNSVSGFVQTATKFSESRGNGPQIFRTSRYISKNVILASGQDSEDILTYLSAYRPSGTDLLVYAKVLNTGDSEAFSSKDWSRLFDASNGSLTSSLTNVNDIVELQYGFPTSKMLFANSIVTSNSSTTVTVTGTSALANNTYIYLKDNSSTAFNVRQVVYVTNSTSITVDAAPSFTSTNAMIGIIPGLESKRSAFLYDENSNIVRYTTSSDAVFDSYIQFALKIVPISTTTALVPRVNDVRSICLQV